MGFIGCVLLQSLVMMLEVLSVPSKRVETLQLLLQRLVMALDFQYPPSGSSL